MAYITHAAATAILDAEGSIGDWPTSESERGQFVERASRRIDQLAFSPEHETAQSPRYTDGYLTGEATDDENAIPPLLAVQVALLAVWYAQNQESFYNRSPAGEDSLCQQLSDLPLSVQTGLWRFVSDDVKIDADQLPTTKQDRETGGSLYPTGTEAASTGEAVGTGTVGVDATARAAAQANTNFLSTFRARVVAIIEAIVPAWARMPNAPSGGGGSANPWTLAYGAVDGDGNASGAEVTIQVHNSRAIAPLRALAAGDRPYFRLPAGGNLGRLLDLGSAFDLATDFTKVGQTWTYNAPGLDGPGTLSVIIETTGLYVLAEAGGVDQVARDAAAAAQMAADAPDVDQVARDAAAAAQMAADAPDVDQTARDAAAAARAAIPAKATNANVDGELDDASYTTVAKVFRAIARRVKAASTSVAGIIEIATQAEADAGTDTTRAMTPALVKRRVGLETKPGSTVAIDASGFDNNLSSSDNTAQKIAQKLDDLPRGKGIRVASTSTVHPSSASQSAMLTYGGLEGRMVELVGNIDLRLSAFPSENFSCFVYAADQSRIVPLTPLSVNGGAAGAAIVLGAGSLVYISRDRGSTNFTVSELATQAASTAIAGTIEIATQAEADAGTDTTRAMTPKLVKRRVGLETKPGSTVAIDASGFDGNLATTDNNVQKVAQKVDDLSVGGGGGSTREWSYELRYNGNPGGLNTELDLTWQSMHSAYDSYVALRQAFTDGDIKMVLLRSASESSIAALGVGLGLSQIDGNYFASFKIGETTIWVTFKSTGATIRFQFNPPTGNQTVNIGVFA